MQTDQLVLQRLDELLAKTDAVGKITHSGQYKAYIDVSLHAEWCTSVLSILERVFGADSVHYKNFLDSYKKGRLGEYNGFLEQYGILSAAKEDYKGGYLFKITSLVSAEVLDDALEQAAEFVRNGYKDAACIVVGVALETTLKRLCDREGIPHGKLDKMNADLAKKGFYNVSMQKQITAWAGLRNDAAHGNWNAYTIDDVKDMHKGVNRFIATQL